MVWLHFLVPHSVIQYIYWSKLKIVSLEILLFLCKHEFHTIAVVSLLVTSILFPIGWNLSQTDEELFHLIWMLHLWATFIHIMLVKEHSKNTCVVVSTEDLQRAFLLEPYHPLRRKLFYVSTAFLFTSQRNNLVFRGHFIFRMETACLDLIQPSLRKSYMILLRSCPICPISKLGSFRYHWFGCVVTCAIKYANPILHCVPISTFFYSKNLQSYSALWDMMHKLAEIKF